MRLLVVALTLSAVIVLGIAAFEAIPAPSKGPANGIVWAGKTFATRADFARWLRSEGVTYRAWARSHPVEAGLTRGQEDSGWDPGVLAVIAAFLGALALGVALVRRRWPESGAAAAHLIGVMGLRGTAAIGARALTMSRWAALTARRSMARARASVSTFAARHRTAGSAAHRLEVVAHSGAGSAEAGARTTRRWTALTARRSLALATAAAFSARHGIGRAAHRLELVALKGGAAAKAGARTTRPWAALRAQRLTALATAAAFTDRRRRSELAWYVTTTVLAAGIGVVVTVWLNGG
jgi:hypothetical protein